MSGPFRFERVIVTGGAGFIGSAVVRQVLHATRAMVMTIDKLTYAGNRETLADVTNHPRHRFARADLCDGAAIKRIFEDFRPDAVLHLAAETHVDRSIGTPWPFIEANLIGTYRLLETAKAYWESADGALRDRFRLLHVSTDEVYGSLQHEECANETWPFRPNSPYSASKAGSDHLVRAWQRTYELPALITHCSNNFGPYQYPEKLIPVLILNALSGKVLPIYGQGDNVRDWLYVADHAEALVTVLAGGAIGETYDIAAGNERDNLTLAHAVCEILDALKPDSPHRPHVGLIRLVQDRPGHDKRYALDPSKIRTTLGWQPRHTFDEALRSTVGWYLANDAWCRAVLARSPARAIGDGRSLDTNPLWQAANAGGED
jgi:dTDP-glucose 4,6-dehydratase